jgi:protein-lysine N-methyltransferase EEF2KMT
MGSIDPGVELLRRQFLQLQKPEDLTLPPPAVLKKPAIQAQIFSYLFREELISFPPPDRYRFRVLKRIVYELEQAITDPEEDV